VSPLAPALLQRIDRDPASFLAEAIMEEASEEAQAAYSDAQSRARDVEMLVRCARKRGGAGA